MNIELVKSKFPQFTWKYEVAYDSYFGYININSMPKKINKDSVTYGHIYIHISGELTSTESRMGLCYQKCETVKYRCRNSHESEFNKSITFDKSLEVLVEKILEKINMDNFVMSDKSPIFAV